MRIHWLQHVPFEGLGCIEDWISAHQCACSSTQLFAGAELPESGDFDFLIVMGGPMGVHDEDKHPWLRQEKRLITATIDRGTPVLGICLGTQLIADCLGAEVFPNAHKEIGFWPIQWVPEAKSLPYLAPVNPEPTVFQWHGHTFDVPEGALRLARSALCENQGFVFEDRVIGLQFHLESTPHSVEQLLTHCADELMPGTGVQPEAEIRSGCRNLNHINMLMRSILGELANKA